MPKYTVNHGYRAYSDGRTFGPFVEGETVELTEADAEWVNRDSPGCLTEVEAKPERQAAKTPDRQHKGGRNRGA